MPDLRNAKLPTEQIEVEAPSDGDIKKISETARAVVLLENEIARLAAALAEKQTILKSLQESALPNAMSEAGVTALELAKGWKLQIEEIVSASIPRGAREGTPDLRPEAFAHLETLGAGDLVKHVITISFGRGEEAWAAKFLRDCAQRKRPLNAVREDSVHSGTLSAFVRERRANGALTDDDRRLFGVFEIRKAVVKRPKTIAEHEQF
jgi:hypothetical protein